MIDQAYQPRYFPPTAAEMMSQKLIGNVNRRIDKRPQYIPEMPNYSKIVFLNKENLAELEGYKASVEIYGGLMGKQEIHVILTGFSWDAAKALFDKLKALPAHEIYSDSSNANQPIDKANINKLSTEFQAEYKDSTNRNKESANHD